MGQASSSRSWWGISLNDGDNGPGHVHWIAGGGTMKVIRYFVPSTIGGGGGGGGQEAALDNGIEAAWAPSSELDVSAVRSCE